MRNEFSKEVKEVFYRTRSCLKCGRSDLPMEIHHITGRGSNSIFNACLICKHCHDNALHTQEVEREFYECTKKYLLSPVSGFRLNPKMEEKDKQFFRDNIHLLLD